MLRASPDGEKRELLVPVTLRLPHSLHERLQLVAHRQRRSMHAEILIALDGHLFALQLERSAIWEARALDRVRAPTL